MCGCKEKADPYQGFIVKVTLCIVDWDSAVCSQASSGNIGSWLRIVELSIAGVSGSAGGHLSARDARSNRRGTQSSCDGWSTHVRSMRLGGLVAFNWRRRVSRARRVCRTGKEVPRECRDCRSEGQRAQHAEHKSGVPHNGRDHFAILVFVTGRLA